MKPQWQKLASLAQEICTLWFQFFSAVFASKGYPFKNIYDAVSKPRDLKHSHNIRAAKQEELRLSRYAIYNTHGIAYEGVFVHYLFMYPNLCLVEGEKKMIEELNSVVKMKDEFIFDEL